MKYGNVFGVFKTQEAAKQKWVVPYAVVLSWSSVSICQLLNASVRLVQATLAYILKQLSDEIDVLGLKNEIDVEMLSLCTDFKAKMCGQAM